VTSKPVSATEFGEMAYETRSHRACRDARVREYACNVQANGPSDPQIASIVVTANRVDIDAGKLAETK
jgi:predicted outer membrane protein